MCDTRYIFILNAVDISYPFGDRVRKRIVNCTGRVRFRVNAFTINVGSIMMLPGVFPRPSGERKSVVARFLTVNGFTSIRCFRNVAVMS